ncbi:hypothetical protein PsYK624_039890 [Phanerochaete sordida]|uniref:Uncharacterized protein n=1 Tax=Phanerochaete sordida TaxID=48140 RepID=A0A9P3G436_9APHY|nr:hypothetical protein PsYK624_039890 [Phanerochaete sordida]
MTNTYTTDRPLLDPAGRVPQDTQDTQDPFRGHQDPRELQELKGLQDLLSPVGRRLLRTNIHLHRTWVPSPVIHAQVYIAEDVSPAFMRALHFCKTFMQIRPELKFDGTALHPLLVSNILRARISRGHRSLSRA